MSLRKMTSALMIVLFAVLTTWGMASAADPVDVGEPSECGETTFTAGNATYTNEYLIVSANGDTQTANISQSGTTSLTAGPFYTQTGEDVTIYYRVFGGPERDLDQPLWEGYGTTGFGAAIFAYAESVGGYEWTSSGPDDPNPFTTWYTIDVESCAPVSMDDCKNGGWDLYGFRNQGQCVSSIQSN